MTANVCMNLSWWRKVHSGFDSNRTKRCDAPKWIFFTIICIYSRSKFDMFIKHSRLFVELCCMNSMAQPNGRVWSSIEIQNNSNVCSIFFACKTANVNIQFVFFFCFDQLQRVKFEYILNGLEFSYFDGKMLY